MFKTRLLQFLHQFRRTKQDPVVEEPVCPDLQTRLQHLSERYPDVEQPAEDVPQVTVYDVDLTDDADMQEHERLREEEKLSLNHWATKRRREAAGNASSTKQTFDQAGNPTNIKQSFEYAVDPVRAALKLTETIEKQSKNQIQSPFPNVINTPEYQSVSGSSYNSLPAIGTDSLSNNSGLNSLANADRNALLGPDLHSHQRSTNEQFIAQRALEAHIRKSREAEAQKTVIDEINEVRVHAQEKPRDTHENLQAMQRTRTQELLQQAKEKSRTLEHLQTQHDHQALHSSGLTLASGKSRASASNQKLPPVPVTVENRKTVGPMISEAAVRTMLRQQSRKMTFVRSLDDKIDDTVLADQWDCLSSNSLFALPDESSTYGTTTEYEEDYEEDLLPYFTETLLMQEDELGHTRSYDQLDSPFASLKPPADATSGKAQADKKAAKAKESKSASSTESSANLQPISGTESSTTLQPYKNFSENALKLIAQKPETPAVTLKWLASHSNPHIRAAVAKNPSTPADTITVLAKDHEAGIRHSIAENVLSSMDALNLLVKDRNPLIAWRAKNTVSQIKEQQRAAQQAKEAALQEAQKEANHFTVREAKIASVEETIAFLQVIARKTNTPARRLDELARHNDARVRAAVAENANAPADILWLLSRDPDSAVKTKVTDNYNCPIEILEAMKEDEDAYVAYQAHSQLNRVLGSTFSDVHVRTATWP